MVKNSRKSTTHSGNTPASSSSKETARSSAFREYADFGRKLVLELGKDAERDTLSRWLAHYLAEKIIGAERAKKPEKDRLQQECCELILQLWRHRADYQNRRPLESFEPVFEALAALKDDQHWWATVRHDKEPVSPAGRWLKLAREVDRSSKTLVRWCIASASMIATEAELEWLSSNIPQRVRESDSMRISLSLAEEARLISSLGPDYEEKLEEAARKHLEDMRNCFGVLLEGASALSKDIDRALGVEGTDWTAKKVGKAAVRKRTR